jgi:hypothetical protein
LNSYGMNKNCLWKWGIQFVTGRIRYWGWHGEFALQ